MSAWPRYATMLCSVILGAFAAEAAAQQDYPNKPIRYISPYAPGGSTTFIARFIGQQLTDAWGQQVVVDNRPGANTIIGTQAAVTARPDGYTLVSVGGSMLAGNYWLAKTPYDPLKDIAPIATLSKYENVLVVPPSSPVNTVADLVALAKAKPGQITYGSSAVGGPTHLLAELFNTVAGIKTLHVPYKGGGPAVSDLMGGHINFFFSNPINVSAQIKSGRLKAIGVTGQSRNVAFPDVPTFAEQGLPAMALTNWQGVGGPAGIPKSIIDRISGEIGKLAAKPDTKDKLNAFGSEPYYNDPQQTAALIRSDIAKYGKIIKDAKIKPVE